MNNTWELCGMKDLVYVSESDTDVASIGGKAINLSHLSQNGVNVPRWLSIAVEFFEMFMGDDVKKIDGLLAAKKIQGGKLSETCDTISRLILSKPFAPDMKEVIEKSLAAHFGDYASLYFSVRSSAVDEDSMLYSFAGQLDSFLYVQYGEKLFRSIKKCFASAYSERVMSYRINNHLPVAGVRPAVIIQEMIFGDVSGVVFTANPLNNNTDQILINAAYGIGEGIVSGELDTDSWVIDPRNKIVRSKIASKKEKITFDEVRKFGTMKKAVEESLWEKPSLTEREINELAGIARNIEALFGGIFQDIEWCIKDGVFFILQSRPITTFSGIDRSMRRTIFDNSNIIESFSGVTSPLTFSFASTMYEAVYRQFYALMGTPQDKIESLSEVFRNMLGYINGRVYYNLNSWFISLQLLPGYNLNKEFMENMMGVKNSVDIHKDDNISLARKIFYEIPFAVKGIASVLYHLMTLDKKIDRFIKNFYAATSEYMDETFEKYSSAEIVNLYNYFIRKVLKEWKAPIVNDLYTMIFFGALTKKIKSLGIEGGENLQNDLLSGQGDLESTKPTKEIIRIANWIQKDDSLRKLFAKKKEKELVELILHSNDKRMKEIQFKLQRYISEYGFRCMNELKLEETSLKEDPSFLFTMLKNYLQKDPIDLEAQERHEKEICRKAEFSVYSKMSGFKKIAFKMVLKNAKKAIRNREELRFMRTKIFGIERRMFKRIGNIFWEEKLIDAPEDVFFLHLNEIFELIEGRSLNIGIVKDIIALRKKRDREYRKMDMPERMYFFGDFYASKRLDIASNEEEEGGETEVPGIFKGVPCCPGVIEGPVKIVLSPADAKLNGEILVAKRTDPGWVPLFPSVSGIIIERGSVLSHSAVVAREMGIPTIVGLRGITEKLANGEKVRMNGSTGIVEKM